MGIREQGYRHYQGKLASHSTRWWTIARQGIRATVFHRGRLVLLLILTFFVFAPFLASGIGSYFAGPREFGFECVGSSGRSALTADGALKCNLYDLFRGWQWLIVPLFVATVATPLVSTELRANALYIYLAKPIRRVDYIVGKTVAVAIWTIPVTYGPPLFLWAMVNLSSSPLARINNGTSILGRILLVQSIFLALLVTLSLAISSMTRRWQVSFFSFLGAYFGLWLVVGLLQAASRKAGFGFASIVHNLVNVAQAIYGTKATAPGAAPSFIIVIGLIALAASAFAWRISKLEVAE